MILDPRIKDRKYIFDCFTSDQTKMYKGKDCYLTDRLSDFMDVEMLRIGTLTDVNANGLFFCGSDAYAYCLPVRLVEPQEKKYRPYTLTEFLEMFPVGRVIKFREKGKEGCDRCLIFNGYRHERCKDQTVITDVYLGSYPYTLDELFDDYEWYDDNVGHWKPFGIEDHK